MGRRIGSSGLRCFCLSCFWLEDGSWDIPSFWAHWLYDTHGIFLGKIYLLSLSRRIRVGATVGLRAARMFRTICRVMISGRGLECSLSPMRMQDPIFQRIRVVSDRLTDFRKVFALPLYMGGWWGGSSSVVRRGASPHAWQDSAYRFTRCLPLSVFLLANFYYISPPLFYGDISRRPRHGPANIVQFI